MEESPSSFCHADVPCGYQLFFAENLPFPPLTDMMFLEKQNSRKRSRMRTEKKRRRVEMITYPVLEKGATIGVTAPSSGVDASLHEMLRLACRRMEELGFHVVCGDTVWTQEKAKSAPAASRTDEFHEMMTDDEISMIFPPWGGELELQVPIIYDIDCGHVPPQMTFINGAYAKIEVADGKGLVTQHFCP